MKPIANRIISKLSNYCSQHLPIPFPCYFNLSCTYQKNIDMSNAWIAFEKAKQINLNDENLTHAFQTLLLTREQKDFIPFYQTAFVINILTMIVCIFFWIAVILWIRKQTKNSFQKRSLCQLNRLPREWRCFICIQSHSSKMYRNQRGCGGLYFAHVAIGSRQKSFIRNAPNDIDKK